MSPGPFGPGPGPVGLGPRTPLGLPRPIWGAPGPIWAAPGPIWAIPGPIWAGRLPIWTGPGPIWPIPGPGPSWPKLKNADFLRVFCSFNKNVERPLVIGAFMLKVLNTLCIYLFFSIRRSPAKPHTRPRDKAQTTRTLRTSLAEKTLGRVARCGV